MPSTKGGPLGKSHPAIINTSNSLPPSDDSSSSSSTDASPTGSPVMMSFGDVPTRQAVTGMMRSTSGSAKARSSILSSSTRPVHQQPAIVGLGFGVEEEEWADLSPFDPLQNNGSQNGLGSRRPSTISITDYPSDAAVDSNGNLYSHPISMGSPMLSATGGWAQPISSRPSSPRLPSVNTHLDPGQFPMRRASANSSHSPTGSSSSLHSTISIQPTPNLSASTSSQAPHSPSMKHGRQISLTSACLPATASYTPSLGNSNKFDAILEDNTSRGSPVLGHSSPILGSSTSGDREKKEWKSFNWMSNNLPDPQEKLAARPKPNGSRSFMCLPYSLVSLLLGPFASILLPVPQQSKASASVTSIPTPGKKAPLPFRLISAAYVCFSLMFLTSRILGYQSLGGLGSTGADSAATHRLIPRTASDGRPAMQLAIGGWAEGWAKGLREKMPAAAKIWDSEDASAEGEEFVVASEHGVEDEEVIIEESVDGVSRKWIAPGSSKVPSTNPLTSLSHPYRFSKMHSKMHSAHHDGIEPFAFRAQNMEHKGDVTACLYTNEAWLDELPFFVQRWNGPVSLVFESLHPQGSPERVEVLRRIRSLRSKEPLIRQLVDVHFLSNPPTSILSGNRSRERMLLNPIATNFHLNLARFFSRTEMVWLVGDARIMPSLGLRKKLSVPSIRKLLLTDGDALVIPTFGALRRTEEGAPVGIPSLIQLRSETDLDQAPTGGVSAEEYLKLASAYVEAHKSTLPISMPKWPKKKATLVGLSSAHPPASVMAPGEAPPSNPVFALWDQAWDPNRGPSNWSLWRKGSLDPRLQESASSGGGAGLGLNGGIGGGQSIYKVVDYELHYAPNVVIGRDSQPWCTERFEVNRAACVYQMFLSGAGIWVLPDEWAFTLEAMDKTDKSKGNEADKLKDSISSRLYTKFHAEACMHYGREFLSLGLWDSPKASHLRSTCARVLSSWGVGLAEGDDSG